MTAGSFKCNWWTLGMFSLVALTWHWAIPEISMTIHVHGWLFGILRARRVLWTGNPRALGGTYHWNSEGMGGVLDLEFPQGKDESVFPENAYFIHLISLQTKRKLTTLLMAAEDKHPLISDVFIWYSFEEENQQRVGFTSSSRKTCCNTYFLLSRKQPHKLFCPFDAKHGLLTEDAISSFKPRKLKFKMAEIKKLHTCNIFRVYKGSSQHILMFCTKLGQCKVWPGSDADLFMRRT